MVDVCNVIKVRVCVCACVCACVRACVCVCVRVCVCVCVRACIVLCGGRSVHTCVYMCHVYPHSGMQGNSVHVHTSVKTKASHLLSLPTEIKLIKTISISEYSSMLSSTHHNLG